MLILNITIIVTFKYIILFVNEYKLCFLTSGIIFFTYR
jgi:hypothetical protein